MRRSVGIDAQLGVGRKAGVDRGGERRQLSLQRSGEILPPFRNAESGAVGRQPRLAFCPRQELGSVVGESSGANDVEVAGLQGVGQVNEYADLERAPVEDAGFGPALGDKALPALGCEAEVDVAQHLVAACVTVLAHDRQRIQQAAVLSRRLNIHQVEKPEQQDAMLGVDWPEQRQVVAAVPGGHGFALLRQGRDTALLRQELSDLTPERGVGVLRLLGFQDLAEDADQGFLDGPVLVVESVELLPGRGLCPPDAAQHHLDQLIAAAHAGLAQQGEQQRMPLARLNYAEKIVHLQRRGLGGELAELGVGDAFQQRIGVDEAGQPIEPIGPEPDRLRGCGPRRLLQAIEGCCRAVERFGQQGVQHGRMVGRQTCHDPIINSPVDFGAQPVHQPVEGAERRQIDRRGPQRLDRPIDEVGGVAHGFGRLEDGAGDQTLGRGAVRRDRKMDPHRRLIAVQRLCSAQFIGRHLQRSQPKLCREMGHGAGMNFLQRRKASEVRACLQQHRQHQATRVAPGAGANEGTVRLCQVVSGAQLLAGQTRARARVGRAVDRRHGMSGKGCAEAAGRSKCFEGGRR